MLNPFGRTFRCGALSAFRHPMVGLMNDGEARLRSVLNCGRLSRYALVVASLFITPDAFAFERGACLEVVKVDAWDFLYIRARPDHRSAKVGAIAPETVSPIVITGACTPPGAPPKRLWCPVTYYVTKNSVRSGYVKAYFTRETPCPPSLGFYKD